MFHLPPDSWLKEFGMMIFSGSCYGVVCSFVGHPLDTIKTKMQVQKGFEGSMLESIKDLWKKEGLLGFYRGVIPPLWGGTLVRMSSLTIYQAHYAYCEHDAFWSFLKKEIPFSGGFQFRTLTGSILGGAGRSLIEQPIEYAKVKRQSGQVWKFREIYQGFSAQFLRSTFVSIFYMGLLDIFKRKTKWTTNFFGQFFSSAIAGTISATLVWPFEIMKNELQAGVHKINLFTRLSQMKYSQIFRGSLPGLTSVFLKNGFAMVALQMANDFLIYSGLRTKA